MLLLIAIGNALAHWLSPQKNDPDVDRQHAKISFALLLVSLLEIISSQILPSKNLIKEKTILTFNLIYFTIKKRKLVRISLKLLNIRKKELYRYAGL